MIFLSDDRRLISYMYAYDNGIKNKNVGFAKTERKGGTVKLWINLKGAYAQEENFNVSFFVRRGEAVVGIYMGKHGDNKRYGAACCFMQREQP